MELGKPSPLRLSLELKDIEDTATEVTIISEKVFESPEIKNLQLLENGYVCCLLGYEQKYFCSGSC